MIYFKCILFKNSIPAPIGAAESCQFTALQFSTGMCSLLNPFNSALFFKKEIIMEKCVLKYRLSLVSLLSRYTFVNILFCLKTTLFVQLN